MSTYPRLANRQGQSTKGKHSVQIAAQVATPRPFLKWAGGKTRLIQKYLPYFPQHFQTYYEPFLGGGAVFFHLLPTRSVLTDINPELVNVYCCVRDWVEPVILLLETHQQNHSKAYYYQVRDGFQPTLGHRSLGQGSAVERAARLIYLNKTCFNGLYRENSKGEFNVPMGSYKNPKVCNPGLLRSVSNVLQSVQIEVRSFDSVLSYAQTDQDFVYFDPPYHPLSSTSNFTAYSRYAFSQEEQVRLRDTFAELAKRKVSVMLSNSDCPLIRKLYNKFKIYEIPASRIINVDPAKRGNVTEVLITPF